MDHARTDSLSLGAGIFERAEESLFLITREAVIEWLNRSMLKLIGMDPESIQGSQSGAVSIFRAEYLGENFLSRIKGAGEDEISFEGYAVFRTVEWAPLHVGYKAVALNVRGSLRRVFLVFAYKAGGAGVKQGALAGSSGLSDENPFPVLRVSSDGFLIYANKGSWLLLDYWNAEPGKRVPETWIKTIGEVMRQGDNKEIEIQIGVKTLLLVMVPVPDAGYLNIFGLDVTRRNRAEQKLRMDAQVFESATEGMMITDADRRIVDVNRAFCTITGYSYEEILGENAAILQSKKHDDSFYTELWASVREKGSWQGEIWDRRKNGEIYPKRLSITSITDEEGRVVRYIGLFSDISNAKQTQDQLFYMANYDSLTGLANRRFFRDRLELSIQQSRRGVQSTALMIIDLDGFKLVNDNLGHGAGDGLLCKVAERIKECVRDSDTVARMGGDEFTVLLPGISGSQNAALIAQKILGRIIEPVMLDHQEVFISSSIGIAFFPEDAPDAEGLMHNADTALYKAKEAGRNAYQFFSPEMNRRTAERLSLHARLRRAIDAGEFFLEYQPQFDATTGTLVGVESLVRWRNGAGTVTCPNDFIPHAEENGLIHEIGDIVLREACMQGAIWLDGGIAPPVISINMSAHQLRRSDFVGRVEAILGEVRFPAQRLELELTESMLIDDSPETIEKLARFRSLGFSLAIDDFGTKYSSLSYLKHLPVHRIKIDRAFVKDIHEDADSLLIATAIIAMGRSMNLEVVAEGVETGEQVSILRSRGCELFQGNYYSPPVSASGMQAFLRRNP